jgi:predicted signal transduction protein with EAL and GGDEF domain
MKCADAYVHYLHHLAARIRKIMASLSAQLRTRTETSPHPDPHRSSQSIWIVCITLIAIVSSEFGYTIWNERRAAIEEHEREMTNLNLALSEYTSRYVAVVDTVLQAMQTRLQFIGIDTPTAFRNRSSRSDIHDDLAKILENVPGGDAIFLLDADGKQVNSSRPGAVAVIDDADRDYVRHFLEQDDDGLYISRPAESRAVGSWMIYLARRVVAPDKRIVGLVVAAIDIRHLDEFYRVILRNTGEAATLLRRDGVILAHDRNAMAGVGETMPAISPWFDTVARNGGTYLSPGFFGAPPLIVTVRPLQDYPLVVNVVLAENVALAAWRNGAILNALRALGTNLTLVGLFYVIFRQFRRQQRQNIRLHQLARSDQLTGLANRVVCVEAIQHLIARAKREKKEFALLYLDLDHFKDVNDTLGHPVGDELLKLVAVRIQANVREIDTVARFMPSTRDVDTVARFGGDEFAVVAESAGDPNDAAMLAKRLLNVLTKPFMIHGSEVCISGSIGVVLYEWNAVDAETLLSHADVALYRAKSEGRGTFRFFTAEMDREVRTRVALEGELRHAIDSDQLFLVYQPQIDMLSGSLVGLEALVRWRHPSHGNLAPNAFIPVAERNGLIVPLGNWVLRAACLQMRVWRDAGVAPPTMAVNVSVKQFQASVDLEAVVATLLTETGLPARQLELELTESVIMETSSHHNDVLQRLRHAGIKIAIDDFGTGYSSLDYLRRFPLDRIKIAQNFVDGLMTGSGNAAIVKATIGLGRELGITVIAEGVETEEQFELLKAWGCTQAQGFYLSRPGSPIDLMPVLRAGYVRPMHAISAEKVN